MNPSIPKNDFSVTAWYAKAWNAFGKWWIPLCLISGILVIFQFIPQLMLQAEQSSISKNVTKLASAMLESNYVVMDQLIFDIQVQFIDFTQKLLRLSLYIFPIATAITITLLVFANAAIKNKRDPISFGRVAYCAVINVIIAFIKVFAFVVFLPLGFYLYTKLLFVSFIMIEEQKGFSESIQTSWRITNGHFLQLFLLVLGNGTIQLAAASTVIGLIPATGFANTARAAAYHALKTRAEQKP